MTGDDYRWEHMSVMERCEVLRARTEAVERWQRGDHSLFDGLIADLARRVAEIEKGHTETMLGHFHGNHARADDDMQGTTTNVECVELARLRRVEEAAREVDSWDPILCGVNDVGMIADLHKLTLALRAALDSEPER